MDKFRELLKKMGVTDETIEKVVNEMGTQKMYLTSEENMDVRYPKLKGDYDALTKQYQEANGLIETLKKNGTDNADLQKKIGDYENKVKDLTAQLDKANLDNAIKVALLEAKATDVDYLTFKLREKGELKVDENGKLKDADKLIGDLKIAYPNQFEVSANKKINEKKLETSDSDDNGGNKITKEQFDKMGYTARVKLFKENPDLYKELAGKTTDSDTGTEE